MLRHSGIRGAADEYQKKSPCYEVGKSADTVVSSAHVGSEGGG